MSRSFFPLSLCPPHLSLLPTQLCNRLPSRPFSPSSFTITHCPCAGHQMTSQPPEEHSSFSRLVSVAGCSCPPARSRAKTQDICLSEQERDAHRPLCPSVSGSYCPVTSSTAYYSVQNNKVVLVCERVCVCLSIWGVSSGNGGGGGGVKELVVGGFSGFQMVLLY